MTEISMQNIEAQVICLCHFVTRNHLSTQNKIDISNEFNRLLALLYNCQLYHIVCTGNSISEHDLKVLIDFINLLYNGGCDSRHKILTDNVSDVCFNLNDIAKKYGVDCAFKQEQIEFVNETGLSNGSWFKCPKGHYFCAEECTTATRLLECPGCKDKNMQ